MPIPEDDQMYSICCDNGDLGELGPGFPLFFEFMKFLCYLMFLLTLIFYLPSVYLIYTAYSKIADDLQSYDNEIAILTFGAFVQHTDES